MSMKIRPLGDRVLVKQDEEPEITKGGIYLPDSVKEAPQWGTVYEVGPGKKSEKNGELVPVSFGKGTKVLFSKYSGTKVKVDGEELLFMREDDILAVLEA